MRMVSTQLMMTAAALKLRAFTIRKVYTLSYAGCSKLGGLTP